MSDNGDVVLEMLRAVEERDRGGVLGLYHPGVEFSDAPSLPYGGTYRGPEALAHADSWLRTWDPLQPTEAERRLDPRIVATHGEEVVALYRQRAVDLAGQRLDRPVVGLYRVRDGRLARAQMFHFDTAAIVDFLAAASGPG